MHCGEVGMKGIKRIIKGHQGRNASKVDIFHFLFCIVEVYNLIEFLSLQKTPFSTLMDFLGKVMNYFFWGGGPIHSIFATLNRDQNFHMLEDYSILEIIFSPFQQPITNYC